MTSGKSTKIERLTEYNPICPSPSFSNYQLTVSLHPLQLLWPQMILKQIPDVRAGLGSGDALVIKFLGYSPCLHKHVSAEELGDLSLRKTRSESTSICVILQLCRGKHGSATSRIWCLMIWGGAVVIIIEMKCPINAMSLNHPETIPLSLTLFCKKSVFREIGPWCQKVWGPTALKDIFKWQMMSDVFIFHSWPTHCRASSTSDSHLQNTSQIPSIGNTKINPKFLKCFLDGDIILTEKCQVN